MGLIDNLAKYAQHQNLSKDKRVVFDSFIKKGFPTNSDEEWKYTSLKKIVKSEYNLFPEFSEIDNSIINKYSLGIKDKIVFVDGNLVFSPEIKGVQITGFSDFDCRNNDAISELNSALAKSGFTIIIEKDIVVENPIEILFFNFTKNSFSQYRNRIIIGENSEVKIVENIQDLSKSSTLVNHFTHVSCNKNTKVEYNKIQNNTQESKLIDCMNIFQNQDSVCEVNTLIFGGGFIRNNLNFEQNGSNCESNMNGISLLDANQFADNHTFVDHKTAHCRSNEMYKGIYLEDSRGVFNGKIMVRQDAQKIDAFQANNNLLLSDNSTIDSKPQLEIYADDVKCSHGCTIGQLDEEALFYMRSRGIGISEAKAVLTYAFASEVIESLSIPELKNLSQKLLAHKLNVNLDFSL
ncbi:MAG: Fe-S cluster assembly protein SufD [Flavobacteriales bacterium]|nr:Fe-S cluster assembly protein SufD [Flavobacteriales bacterium]